jgi:hypothetical protein
MKSIWLWTTWAALCGSAVAVTAAAAELDGVRLDDSAQVAGKELKLNGAGLSLRLVFKVYAISLYLAEPRQTTEAVLSSEGPRRIAILMLRDVSGEEFGRAMADSAADSAPSRLDHGVLQVGLRIAAKARGLRKGDRLTMDWVPGVGAVIELNQKPLIEPVADRDFYNALLNIWLGARPADPALKTRLLGRAPT